MALPRKNIIWRIPKEDLERVVKNSSTLAEVFTHFSIAKRGNYYRAIKQRLDEEGIDYSHIPLGSRANKGRTFPPRSIPLEKILVENSTYKTNDLKKRLIKEGLLENKCAICNLPPEWNGKPLVMRLDHINGVNNDHRFENLRLLCPNCDSQTDTYAGKNNKRNFCEKCHKHLPLKRYNKTNLCKACFESSRERKRKVERPDKEELLKLIINEPFVRIGKRFGVSDNAVRKWCKYYGLPFRKKEIREYIEKKEESIVN